MGRCLTRLVHHPLGGMGRCLTNLVSHLPGKNRDVSLGWSITPPPGWRDLRIDMGLEGCLVVLFWDNPYYLNSCNPQNTGGNDKYLLMQFNVKKPTHLP